jgi:hypothetical protein
MQRAPSTWEIDPDDPRAPPQDVWDRMSPAERRRVLEDLPSKFDISERRAEDAEHRAEALEARLAEALAEIERLKRERG